jgi:hypothetical protein
MLRPLTEFDNIPWKTSSAIYFQANLVGSWNLGKYVFTTTNKVPLIPSERAQYGSLYLFDSWYLGSNIEPGDWQKSIRNTARVSIYSTQNGESLFKAPLPATLQSAWYPLRQAWVPSGSPSSLEVGIDVNFDGLELVGYDYPSISIAFLAYEITDKAYIDQFLRGWQDIAKLDDPLEQALANGTLGVHTGNPTQIISDGRVMRRFQ